MTTTAQRAETRRMPADASHNDDHDTGRNNARAGGIFYLLTFAASLPAFVLLNPILKDPGFITGASHDTQVMVACLFDFITALAGIGSAVAVFPIARRASESLALGFVMSRMLEAAVIMIGVLALLTVVVLRQDLVGTAADPSALTTTGHALIAGHNWSFLFGPGFMASVNAVLFGTLLYRSRLVPRIIPTIGLIGAPLLLTANLFTLFGHNTQTGAWTMLATIPVAAWELSVGFYMTFKGFKRNPVTEATA
jgi:Domain of unknown function (DUF4386)